METVRRKKKARKGPKNDDLKNKCHEHLKIYLFNMYVFIRVHIYLVLFHLTALSIGQILW